MSSLGDDVILAHLRNLDPKTLEKLLSVAKGSEDSKTTRLDTTSEESKTTPSDITSEDSKTTPSDITSAPVLVSSDGEILEQALKASGIDCTVTVGATIDAANQVSTGVVHEQQPVLENVQDSGSPKDLKIDDSNEHTADSSVQTQHLCHEDESENIDSVRELLDWFDGEPNAAMRDGSKRDYTEVDCVTEKRSQVESGFDNVSQQPISDKNGVGAAVNSTSSSCNVQKLETLVEKETRTISEATAKFKDTAEEKKIRAMKIQISKPDVSKSGSFKPSSAFKPSPYKSPSDHGRKSADEKVSPSKRNPTKTSSSKLSSGGANRSTGNELSPHALSTPSPRKPIEEERKGVSATACRSLKFESSSGDDCNPSKKFRVEKPKMDKIDDSEVQFLGHATNSSDASVTTSNRPSGNPISVRVSDTDARTYNHEFKPAGTYPQDHYLNGDVVIPLAPSELVVKARGMDPSMRLVDFTFKSCV